MAELELVRDIIPRALALFVRKCGHAARMIWPATCINCQGKGKVPLESPHGMSCVPPVYMVCPNCEGVGYFK